MRRYAFVQAFLLLEGLGLALNAFYVVASAANGSLEGETLVVYAVAVAAAETAVGLSLFLALVLGGGPRRREVERRPPRQLVESFGGKAAAALAAAYPLPEPAAPEADWFGGEEREEEEGLPPLTEGPIRQGQDLVVALAAVNMPLPKPASQAYLFGQGPEPEDLPPLTAAQVHQLRGLIALMMSTKGKGKP